VPVFVLPTGLGSWMPAAKTAAIITTAANIPVNTYMLSFFGLLAIRITKLMRCNLEI